MLSYRIKVKKNAGIRARTQYPEYPMPCARERRLGTQLTPQLYHHMLPYYCTAGTAFCVLWSVGRLKSHRVCRGERAERYYN